MIDNDILNSCFLERRRHDSFGNRGQNQNGKKIKENFVQKYYELLY